MKLKDYYLSLNSEEKKNDSKIRKKDVRKSIVKTNKSVVDYPYNSSVFKSIEQSPLNLTIQYPKDTKILIE